MNSRSIYRSVYFLAQQMRGGVDWRMIDAAEGLLNQPWSELSSYVDERLRGLHGASAGLAWLAQQNPLDRSAAREQIEAAALGASPRHVEWRRTSGSTGAPLAFPKDRQMTAWMDAAMWAAYRWHGVSPGQAHARFWGLPRDPVKRLRRKCMDRMLHRRRLDAFEMSRENSIQFFHRLLRFGPRYVHAYPTLLRSFVEHCTAAKLDGSELRIQVVICGGELLVESTRKAIGEFFGCRVVDEYGCTESGLLTLECEAGTPHILPVACYPEVLSDDGRSLDEGVGEVVVTDLYGRIAPLVRYRLSDRARIGRTTCACGRNLPYLKPEMGRIQDFIHTPGKGAIYATILAYTVPEGIARFRAYQVRPDAIVAEVVLATKATASTIDLCKKKWKKELGIDMEIDLHVVPKIDPEPSGKLRYFIPTSEIPPAKLKALISQVESTSAS